MRSVFEFAAGIDASHWKSVLALFILVMVVHVYVLRVNSPTLLQSKKIPVFSIIIFLIWSMCVGVVFTFSIGYGILLVYSVFVSRRTIGHYRVLPHLEVFVSYTIYAAFTSIVIVYSKLLFN